MTSHPPDFESLLARLTEDIDLTLAAGPESLSRVLVACQNLRLEPLPEDVEAFVRQTFVLPAAEPETGIRVDFIFSTTPYERQAIERAVRVDLKGVAVPFATAEDLILHKLFAGRARDLEDVAAVVRRQGAKLDWEYLERWAESFAEVPGRQDLPDRLRKL
jgi:Nucleotidyl transferase AbiEii toxin, Type IV TA system